MFKRILLVLMIGSFMTGTAFAGMKEVREAYKAKDYMATISKADEVLADENASDWVKADAQRHKGYSYYFQGDGTKALIEFQKVITNFPEEKIFGAYAQRYIGYTYYGMKEDIKSIAALEKVITDFPERRDQCLFAQYFISKPYKRLGEMVKAQEALCKVCINYNDENFGSVSIDAKGNEQPSFLEKTFREIKQKVVGDQRYAEVLSALIKIPNTAKTARFLGLVGSQMTKPDLKKYFE